MMHMLLVFHPRWDTRPTVHNPFHASIDSLIGKSESKCAKTVCELSICLTLLNAISQFLSKCHTTSFFNDIEQFGINLL